MIVFVQILSVVVIVVVFCIGFVVVGKFDDGYILFVYVGVDFIE